MKFLGIEQKKTQWLDVWFGFGIGIFVCILVLLIGGNLK